jgi:Cu(I)/Ag(I) efflux system protein CusF
MKLIKTNLSLVAATAVLALSLPHLAHAADAPAKDGQKTEMTAMAADMADGEIRKVDKDSSKVTIKHGEIKNLDMPAMTMVFKVKDPAMLDAVKVGDKIRFKAVNEKGAITVVDLVPMK